MWRDNLLVASVVVVRAISADWGQGEGVGLEPQHKKKEQQQSNKVGGVLGISAKKGITNKKLRL